MLKLRSVLRHSLCLLLITWAMLFGFVGASHDEHHVSAEQAGRLEKVLEGEEARKYAMMLYHGYATNRDRHKHYYGTSTWRISNRIPNLKAGLEGNLAPDYQFPCFGSSSPEGKILFARSGNARFIRSRIPEELRKRPFRGTGTTCFGEYDLLFDNQYFLRSSPGGLAWIGEQSKWPQWSVDVADLWYRSNIRSSFEDEMDRLNACVSTWPWRVVRRNFKIQRNVPLRGHTTTQFSAVVLVKDPEEIIVHIYNIDEQQGYLPIRHLYAHCQAPTAPGNLPDIDEPMKIKAVMVTTILDVRKIGRTWWPFHWTYGDLEYFDSHVEATLDNALELRGKWLSVMEGRVESIEIGYPPTEYISVDLPKGTLIVCSYGERAGMEVRKSTRVTAEELPRLVARYNREPEPATKPSPAWRTVAAVSLALLCSISLFTWVGHRWYRRQFG